MRGKRKVYLDLLRIIAAFLVIFTHTGHFGSKLYESGNYGTMRNMIYIMADVFRCINIPIFFMISGALLLDREETYEQLFKKHIFKYVIVTIIFSIFYYLFYLENESKSLREIIKNIYGGTTIGLLWFLYTYIGFLLILPFIRKMVECMNETDFKYLIILGILFKGVLDVGGNLILGSNFGIPCYLVTDSIFFPIMGYYFDKYEKEKRFFLGIGGLVVTILNVFFAALMVCYDMKMSGVYSETYLFSFKVIPSLYLFCVVKCWGEKLEKKIKIRKAINTLGECALGVYLFGFFLQPKLTFVHAFAIKYLYEFPLISCFIYVIAVVSVGFLITYILRKIPIFRWIL